MHTDIAPDYLDRLQLVDWAVYRSTHGSGDMVRDHLARLVSEDQSIAFDASVELSDSLCHQHAYMLNATLPALPFILEVLDVADDRLTVNFWMPCWVLPGIAIRMKTYRACIPGLSRCVNASMQSKGD